MFAFVKKIFGKAQPEAVTRSITPVAAPAPVSPPAPSLAPARPEAEAAPEIQVFSRETAPATVVPAAPPAPCTFAPAEPVFSNETIDLPLKKLWSKLSAELQKAAVNSPNGDALLRLPLNVVQVHLARGSMKLPLGQFRRFSPETLFAGSSADDALGVDIPISEILPRLKPEHLARRPGQRKVEVPDDIEPIFGPDAGKNGKLRIATEKTKAAPAPAAAIARAVAPLPEPKRELSPAPVAALPVPPLSTTQLPAAAAPSLPTARATEPLPSEPIRALKLDPALATLRPKTEERTLTIALMDVANFWAEKGQSDLEKLYRNSVEIPMTVLEAALKKGKTEFPWRELRPWIRLASGNTLPTLPDDMKVEFPLSYIAPRFLEQQAKAAPRKKIQVGSDIPDIFVRHVPDAEPEKPVEPPPAPAEDANDTGPQELGAIFGQPDKKSWSLGEISQCTSTLPGVAGAIIATSDGLLVGGSWPGVGGEAVAAFVPQMFSRVANYTKELQLGEPGHFTLLVENVPLQIFKSANSYFTIIGRAGESLPTRQLSAIATRLAESPTAS